MGGGNLPSPPCWFSLNNSETVKAVTLPFAAFSDILLEIFVPNLVSLTSSSLQILGKTQTGVFSISGFLVQFFINENFHNSRTSHDTDMKLGAVTTLDKRNTATSTKFDKDFILANCDFQFMANLQPSRSCILDAWLIKLTFSLTITFYLTKFENRI